ADRGLVRDLNGNIATWLDNSTALNNASQADATKRPKQVPHVAELNGAPVLRFNEETSPKDDHLIFDNRIQQIRTVFWVIKENPNASIKFRHVLGDTDTMPFFHRGCCRPGFPPNDTTKTLWSQDYTSSYVINGTTRLNMQTVNGLQTNAPTRYSILSVKTTAGVEANAFVIDRFDVTHEYRTWDGDLAELLIYCQPLSDELIRNVEAYLNDKYAPPVNLGPDIVLDYGFCTPVQLCAGDRFVSYFWSTGDTTPCITANGPGVYSVIATNIFGVTSVDAVHITGGLNTITFDDTIHICMGDSVVWDTQLGYDYYFEWQKGDIRGSNFQTVSNDSFYIIREPGYYFVKVTDSFLCSATTDTIFASYDSFRVQATLGPDTLLCDGNRLRLIAGSEVASSYLWSDNTTDSTLTVTQTGDYSLTVQNIHGCIAHDTVYVEIFGVAPHADFSFDRTCFGDTTEFTEQSTSFIIAWRWSFGDGTIDVTQHPEHYYQTPGTFNVKLIVTDSTGCSQDATKQVVIYPLPEARFTHELANCANEAVNFTDASAVQPGQTITAWQWTFGDNAVSNSQHPSHLYQNSGLYPVSLTVTTNRQCVNTAYDTLEIFPELVAGIRAENLCFDLTARFCDNSPGHSNVAWYWDFGDMFTSTKECPLHNFPDPGDYVVTLQVRNAIGCVKTVSDTITITARPTVDFDNPSLCERKAFQFTDKTITNSGDDVVAWRWNFGDQTPVSVAENPFHAFADVGAYTVRLDVQTRNGCASSATKTVEVIAPPVADFDFSPKYGAAPLTVTFSNHSTGASGYVWNFGDGSPLSLDDEPVHVFQQNEAVIITLVASNLPGCSDTAAKPLTIATATLDVSLEKIILSHHFYNGECTYLLDMSAFIINNGTIDVTGFDITASNSAGGIILEHWDGNFNNRQLTYEFAAQFLVTDCGEDVVICMEVIDPNGQPDQNPSNNRLCTTLSDDLVIIGPYPNPAGDFTSLDVLLPAKGNFRLTNYNILGRELGRLSGQREEGYHSISIDTRHLPSGVYFLVVEYLDDECVLKYAVR
ncbi:MAG TPA: PKD domain-containing protein, partial [Chitinophagales bacterium]|nr:PKD domain-containing protein [Chitinophagales bacterium]